MPASICVNPLDGRGGGGAQELLGLPNWQLFWGYGRPSPSAVRTQKRSICTRSHDLGNSLYDPCPTLAWSLLAGPIAKSRTQDVRERVKNPVRRKCARHNFWDRDSVQVRLGMALWVECTWKICSCFGPDRHAKGSSGVQWSVRHGHTQQITWK